MCSKSSCFSPQIAGEKNLLSCSDALKQFRNRFATAQMQLPKESVLLHSWRDYQNSNRNSPTRKQRSCIPNRARSSCVSKTCGGSPRPGLSICKRCFRGNHASHERKLVSTFKKSRSHRRAASISLQELGMCWERGSMGGAGGPTCT